MRPFEDSEEKGEAAGSQNAISLFPIVFSNLSLPNCSSLATVKVSSANMFPFDQPKILSFMKRIRLLVIHLFSQAVF